MDWALVANIALTIASLTITFVVIPAFLLLVNMRDSLRDMSAKVGQTHPPSGMLGDIQSLKERVDNHHEWLIRVGYGRRFEDRGEQ